MEPFATSDFDSPLLRAKSSTPQLDYEEFIEPKGSEQKKHLFLDGAVLSSPELVSQTFRASKESHNVNINSLSKFTLKEKPSKNELRRKVWSWQFKQLNSQNQPLDFTQIQNVSETSHTPPAGDTCIKCFLANQKRKPSRQIDVSKMLDFSNDSSLPKNYDLRSDSLAPKSRVRSRSRSDSILAYCSCNKIDKPEHSSVRKAKAMSGNFYLSPSTFSGTRRRLSVYTDIKPIHNNDALPVVNSPTHSSVGSATSMVVVLKKQQTGGSQSATPIQTQTGNLDKISEYEASARKNTELLRRRVINFLMVPWEIEKLMLLGMAICTNALLKVFVDLPVECSLTLKMLFKMLWFKTIHLIYPSAQRNTDPPLKLWDFATKLAQVYKMLIMILSLAVLSRVDSSRAYHIIRAQSALKLYFIFSSLELIDKLCASFGLDIIDSMEYSIYKALEASESHSTKFTSLCYALMHCFLALGYMILHSAVLYIQVLSLNAAANSYSQQLLSLLISNQFVELKGNILKKFEKENFFQLTCGDITERFQQTVFMALIFMQNFLELANSEIVLSSEISYFKYFFSLTSDKFVPFSLLMDRVILPICLVLGTEMLVDWIKHAFIAKYNWLRPQIYSRYGDILCRDLVGATPEEDSFYAECTTNFPPEPRKGSGLKLKPKPPYDLPSKVARRIGLLPYPLAVLILLIITQSINLTFGTTPNPKTLISLGFKLISGSVLALVSPVYLFVLICIKYIIIHLFGYNGSTVTCLIESWQQKFANSALFGLIKFWNFGTTQDVANSPADNTPILDFGGAFAATGDAETAQYIYSMLFIVVVYFVVVHTKFMLDYQLDQYSIKRYLKFCRRNVQVDQLATVPSADPNQSSSQHPSSIPTPNPARNQSRNQDFKSSQDLSYLKPVNLKESGSLSTPTPTRKMNEHKPQSSITKFDDLTKKSDLQNLQTLKKMLALNPDPDEVEWEKRKPVWSLDNVSRYSIVKSRIP